MSVTGEHFPGCHPEDAEASREAPTPIQDTEPCWHCGTATAHGGCGCADGQRGPNRPALISKLVNDHLHDCGIKASLHQLRHRFGTQAYAVNHDIRAVQEMLGHKRVQSTAGYAAFSVLSARAAVEGIPVPPRLHVIEKETA